MQIHYFAHLFHPQHFAPQSEWRKCALVQQIKQSALLANFLRQMILQLCNRQAEFFSTQINQTKTLTFVSPSSAPQSNYGNGCHQAGARAK